MRELIQQFMEGGWLAPVIAGMGMTMRLLVDDKSTGVLDLVRKVVLSVLASLTTWLIIKDMMLPDWGYAVTYGVIGLVSPEIIMGLLKIGANFSKDPIGFIRRLKP